ncbi:MAG: hypothetical protein GVY17_06950 [Cyanobacteria bacterium]|nr:hypothetical protein [Cyanobacteria bacterium GSL.Bin21]
MGWAIPGQYAKKVKSLNRNCLRLSCGLPWSSAVEQALKTLGTLTHQLRNERGMIDVLLGVPSLLCHLGAIK